MTLRRSPRSRTTTLPCVTEVFVPAHVSVTLHFVPRTVAVEFRPRVRKCPLTLENRVRRRLRAVVAAAGLRAPPFGSFALQLSSPPPTIEIVVKGFFLDCAARNWPRLNVPRWVAPFALVANGSATCPLVVSSTEP